MKKIFLLIILIQLLLGIGLVFIKDLPKFKPKLSEFENSLRETSLVVGNFEKQIYNPPPLIGNTDNRSNSILTKEGVLEWTRIKRAENVSYPILLENDVLDVIAEERLDDMFAKQYFDHISPLGNGVSDVAQNNSYEYITIGENIALGNFKDDQTLVQAWMDSPGHRANILNSRYTEIGIAVRKGQYKGEETWLGIQVFGLPLSSCPITDETLKAKIDSNKAQISDLERSADNARNELDVMHPETNEEARIYNEKVREYNKIIAEINPLIDKTKDLILKFNAQVDSFNACAEGK